MEFKKKLQSILFGVAMIMFLFAAPLLFPIAGGFFMLFTPLPIFFYRLKLGRVKGLLFLGTIILILSLLAASFLSYLLIFLWLVMLGLILSELIEANFSIEKIITLACVAGTFLSVVFIYFYTMLYSGDVSVIETVSGFINKNLNLILKIYKETGIKESEINLFSSIMGRLEFILIRIAPSFIVSMTIIISLITILTAKKMFEQKLDLPDLGELTKWKAPEPLVWYLIGSVVMLLLPIGNWMIVGVNGVVILATVYLFQGISIISYYFEKKKLPMILKCSFYTIILVQKVFLAILVGVGLFDTWFNFRRIKNDINVKNI